MKKYIFYIISYLIGFECLGQQIQNSTISSSGNSINRVGVSENLNISSVVGQSAIISGSSQNSSMKFSQGFKWPFFSQKINFKISEQGDVQNNVESFNVFPNPFTNYFTVQINQIKNTSVKVFISDLAGKMIVEKIFPESINSQLVNIKVESLKDLKPGSYVLSVYNNGKFFSKKILKNDE